MKPLRKILVLGDLILDETVNVRIRGLSVEQEGTLIAQVEDIDIGLGGAGNVALNLKVLGAEPVLFGVTANDEPTKKLSFLLGREKIDTVTTYWIGGDTSHKIRYMTADGRQLLRVDSESPGRLQPNFWGAARELPLRLAHELADNAPGPVVVLVDYSKGFFDGAEQIMVWLNAMSCPVLVDPGRHGDWKRFQGPMTTFKVNLRQCVTHYHANVHKYRDMLPPIQEPVMRDFDAHKRYTPGLYQSIWSYVQHNLIEAETSFKYLWITCGAGGMVIGGREHGDMPLHVCAPKVDVADVTGAGDTALATAAFVIACDNQHAYTEEVMQRAVKTADIAASIAVKHRGCYAVTQADLTNVWGELR